MEDFMNTEQRLSRDEWGRHQCFLAEWHDPVGASSVCLFSNLDAAIFFVVSGIGPYVDWDRFPDPMKTYPYEDRDGTRDFTPAFRIEQTIQRSPQGSEWQNDKKIRGAVTKMTIADDWTVGNGIAESSKRYFAAATGRDEVHLRGEGDRLCAEAGRVHHATAGTI
jgi:hypothetical protein